MSYKRWLPLLLVVHGAVAYAEGDEPPPDELLEFLGSYESADGKWLDPSDFEVPLTQMRMAERGDSKDE